MIFGGVHNEYGLNTQYVWRADGSYMFLQRFNENMILVHKYHKTFAIGPVENVGNISKYFANVLKICGKFEENSGPDRFHSQSGISIFPQPFFWYSQNLQSQK